MKALVQRVDNAKVIVDEEMAVSIGKGILVFIGFHKNDTEKDLEWTVHEVLNMKIFDEGNEKWKLNVIEKQLEVLIVSQFTLYNSWKGNTPDFHKMMGGEKSQEFYNKIMERAKCLYDPEKVKDGVFGVYRQIYLENDGPVTFHIESPQEFREIQVEK